MSDLIELNFRNARKQAEVLERLAQRLKTISESEAGLLLQANKPNASGDNTTEER